MKDDLLATQVSIQDHILAVSTGTAIVTDQNILMTIRHDESVARHDHQLARGMDGAEHEVLDNVGEGNSSKQEFDDSDAISTVMGDLMERMHLSSKDDEASPKRVFKTTQRGKGGLRPALKPLSE